MIKDFLPIPLIPAAWAVTFATLVYPGIETYWIQHMNLFITVFLAIFGAFSLGKMSVNPVLNTWRNVIAAGFIFTGLGTVPFYFQQPSFLMDLSLIYWFVIPGIAFKITSIEVEKYSKYYNWLYYLTLPAVLLFFSGAYTESRIMIGSGLALVTGIQTLSIILASRMDHGW